MEVRLARQPLVDSDDPRSRSGRIEWLVGAACLLIVAVGCFVVLRPFLSPILWGVLLSFATWPVHMRLTRALGDRRGLSAAIMTLAAALVFLLPVFLLASSVADNVAGLIGAARDLLAHGLPAPPDWIGNIPLAGPRLHDSWARLAADSNALGTAVQAHLGEARQWLMGLLAGLSGAAIQLLLSLVIAFFLFRDGVAAAARLTACIERLAGDRAPVILEAAAGTVKGVIYGVLGTDLIQCILATAGFRLAGVPGALLLGFVCFFLTLIPLGPVLIWVPATVWLAWSGSPGAAIFLALWSIFVFVALENVLRAYLIGRGSTLPTLLVLLGLMGGLLAFGFLGLFIGPTLLAVGYVLTELWVWPRRTVPGTEG